MTPTPAVAVPALYAPWLDAVVPGGIRTEPASTCDGCPMCSGGAPRFRADLKCCGYLPRLPNYLVGRGLRAGGAGAATLRARIEARVAVDPIGLGCPPDYAAAWQLVQRTTGFGSDPSLRCPHFADGACTIWASREAVCTTWFCRFDRGEAGVEHWRALRALLQTLEHDLSRWACVELGLDPSQRPVSWGPFADDRERVYLEAAGLVEALSWDEVRRIGGFGLKVRIRELKRAARARDAAPPEMVEVRLPGG